MRELNTQEMEEVSGGVLPLIAVAISFAGHVAGFSGPATWAISSIGLILSTYSAAVYVDSM